ncbi:MAG: hypothetical protein OEX12_13445 [Gammaproteobacteria bacterium]|nr:hypothetical protein [Gammaproteobacteria bacterium]
MHYVFLILNWGFGGLFMLTGLVSVLKDPLPGFILIVIGAFLLPPIRNFIYSKTNKSISVKQRSVILVVLIILLGHFAGEAEKRRADELAQQQAAEKLAALTAEFNEGREAVFSIINKAMAEKDYDKAITFTDYFLPVNDPDITALSRKAKTAKQTADLLAKIKTTKSSDHNQLKDIYSQLSVLHPSNATYKSKVTYHTNKSIAAAKKRKQEEARKKQLEMQFSAWDGSHIALERHIKKNMNDPDSYEHVETGYWDRGDHLVVSTTFRGRNAYGGMVKNTLKAKVTLDGKIIEVFQ